MRHAETGDAELEQLRRLAEKAVLRGGEVVSGHFGRPLDSLELKGPGDYLTEIDHASEAVIRDLLAEGTPDIPVVAEEEGGKPGPTYWCVDPLDGTRNFSLGMPIVAVSVALISDGLPIVGVVGAPKLGLLFSGARGLGAWSGPKRLRVSVRPPEQAIVSTGFPVRDRSFLAGYLPTFEAVLWSAEDIRRTGSAALDLAWVAAGVFDGFFHLNLGEWDLAAGALLVEEAGGKVTDWAGGPHYMTGDLLAGSPGAHALLMEAAAQSPYRERSLRRAELGRD